MQPRVVTALAPVASLAFLALLAGASPSSRNPTMCDPPERELSKWNEVSLGAVTARVPREYHLERSDVDFRLFNAGGRYIGLVWGPNPHLLVPLQSATLMSTCSTTIAGRAVQITVFKITIIDATMAPSGHAGAHFMALAQWPAAVTGMDVTMYIFSPYPGDLQQLRHVFWTMSFPSDSTPASTPAAGGGAPSDSARRDSTRR